MPKPVTPLFDRQLTATGLNASAARAALDRVERQLERTDLAPDLREQFERLHDDLLRVDRGLREQRVAISRLRADAALCYAEPGAPDLAEAFAAPQHPVGWEAVTA